MRPRNRAHLATPVIAGALAAILVGSLVRSQMRSGDESDTTGPVSPPVSTAPEASIPTTPSNDAESVMYRELNIESPEERPGDHSTNKTVQAGKDLIADFKFAEAQATFQKLAGNNTVAEYYLGVLSAYFGKRDEAQTHLNAVITKNDDPLATSSARRFLDAYALFATYRDGPPEFLDALISRELLAAHEPELAIEKLRFVTSQNAEYTDAWILLGSAYLVHGNDDEALSSLQHAIPSRKPEAYYWLGLAYLYQDNPQKALAAFKQAQQRGYEEEYKIHEKMGDSYVLLRQYRSAVQSYEKALEVESRYAELYVRPVWIYIDLLKQPDKALVLAKQARTLFPDSALAHNLLGWSYLADKDFARAKVSLDLARSMDPKLAAVYLNLGMYYVATENIEEALASYEKAASLDPDGSVGERAQDEYQRLVETVER